MSALTFTAPPPGLAPLVNFELDAIEGADGLFSLQSLEESTLRLFVLDAAVYLPDYAPVISNSQLEALSPEPAALKILVVANPGESGTTVNLMAPIVVNTSTGLCAQVVLDGSTWPIKAVLELAS
jgi:flagellar assembly factor FliW